MTRSLILSTMLCVAAALGACNKNSGTPAASASAAIAENSPEMQEARTKFNTLCSTCHGMTGSGDGAAAAALTPKPRNFHDATWQASVTDQHIETIILSGGPAVGKSPLMPPNPDLQGKPQVVAALRQIIRGFGH